MAGSAILADYQARGTTFGSAAAQPQRAQDLATYIAQQVDFGEEMKRAAVQDAWTYLNFWAGNHWSFVNPSTGRIEEPPLDEERVRLVLNYSRRVVEVLVAKATENKPGLLVLPATNDDRDRDCARASEKLLDHLWDTEDMANSVTEFARLVFTMGIGFLKCGWDPEGGREYTVAPDSMEAKVALQHGVTGPLVRRAGAPTTDVLSLFEVGWDPGARNVRSARWMYHQCLRHVDEVRAAYPETSQGITPGSFRMDHRALRLHAAIRGSGRQDAWMRDHVAVTEYFERPSPRYPKGLFGAVAGRHLLAGPTALPYGDLPFVAARHLQASGEMVGAGALADCLAPQKELNKKRSQRIEHVDQMVVGKWLVAEGSIAVDITDQAGEVIEYDPLKPAPRQANIQPLPAETQALEREALDDLRQLSGVSEISMGGIPPGISGRAIGMAADLDATMHGPTIRQFEAALAGWGRWMLAYWQKEMAVPETLRVIGLGGVTEAVEFHADDIRSTDVRVVVGSMLPKHPSYRREQVVMFFERGMLGPPADPRTAMRARKLLEFGGLEDLYGDTSKARLRAREENHTLGMGHLLTPQPDEDHVTHIDEHDGFMESIDFRLLPEAAQRGFILHKAWHFYFESQNEQGVPYWQHYDADGRPAWDGGHMPPALPPAARSAVTPAGGPAGAPAAPAPLDVFGPEPAPNPPATAAEIATALGALPGARPVPLPESQGMIRGPGLAENDTSAGMPGAIVNAPGSPGSPGRP